MKRRGTDPGDHITEEDVKRARIPWWKAIRLCLMQLPTIYKIIVLVIGVAGGTLAAPELMRHVSDLAGGDTTIPEGETTAPDAGSKVSDWRADVTTALQSQKNAVDSHSEALAALRDEIRKLEARLNARQETGDKTVSERVTANTEAIEVLQGVVQP